MLHTQPHEEKHSNTERWLLTYADMITLLTAFFLMLYSMSVMSKGKFTQVASSVRTSFGGATGWLVLGVFGIFFLFGIACLHGKGKRCHR